MAIFLNETKFPINSHFKLVLEYDKVMNQDANNHKVTYYLYLQSLDGYSGSGTPNSVKGIINNVQVGAISSIGVNKKVLIGTKVETIQHNDDGTGSTLYGATIDSAWASLGDASVSGKLTLPKINRASTWAFTSTQMANIEDTLTLKINKYVSNYRNKVVVSNADGSVVVRTIDNVENNYALDFTNEELNKIYTLDNNENLTNLKFKLALSTFDTNNVQLGTTQYVTISANLLNANPTFTYTIVETEQKVIDLLNTNSASTIIKSFSKPKLTINATALKGASIKSITMTNGTQANAGANPYTFVNAQTGDFRVVVTDSRNLTREQVISRTLVNYTPVYINSYSFRRQTQTSSNILLNADITCYSGSINSISNIPTVMYKMGTNGSYVEITSGFTFQNNKITFIDYSLGEILPYTQSNKFYLYVLDLLTEDVENEIVSKGVSTFEAGEHDFQVNGTLYLANDNRENKRAINVSAQGNKLYRMNDNGSFENFVPTIFKGVIDDLNNATVDGSYTWYKDATNRPWSDTTAWGCVMVQNNNGWIFQTAYATYDVNNSRIAHRGYINNAWTEWSQVPTKDYVDASKTYQYAYKPFTRLSGNMAVNSWTTLCEDLSITLPVGEYMVIFCPSVTGSASGITTFNPVIDGTRTVVPTRQTVPFVSGLVSSAQCIASLTVATQKAYTFNIQEYANAITTVSSAGLYIYKLN